MGRKAPAFVQPILQWEKKQNVVITDSHEADISFERFVNFIVFEVEFNIITHGSLHWWPYTNLCHLCHIHHDFIGKLETLATDIETLSNNDRFANFNLSTLVSGKKFNQNNQKTDTSLGYFQQLTFETIKKLY